MVRCHGSSRPWLPGVHDITSPWLYETREQAVGSPLETGLDPPPAPAPVAVTSTDVAPVAQGNNGGGDNWAAPAPSHSLIQQLLSTCCMPGPEPETGRLTQGDCWESCVGWTAGLAGMSGFLFLA